MAIENTHAKRLRGSIAAFAGGTVADEVISARPLPKAPSVKQRAEWAEAVCAELGSRFGEGGAKAIREGCACGPSIGKLEKARAACRGGGMEAIARHLDGQAAHSYVDGGSLYISYPRCYCSFVNMLPAPAPKAWCHCSSGYVKRTLEYALERGFAVEVLESVQWGDSRCLMKATPVEGGE